MNEGKELFRDHLRRTNPAGVTKARFEVTSSGFDGSKDLVTVSHLNIEEGAGGSIRIRKRLLSRFEDFDRLRFFLDQSIDLAEDPVPGVAPVIDVAIKVWDRINERTRHLPFESFTSFSQTSIRLMDLMLPLPGLVSRWDVRLGGAGTATDPRCRILELSLLDPLPEWLSPGLERVAMHLDDGDLRLHRVEQSFREGRSRSIATRFEPGDGGQLVPVVETRGFDGGWTKVKLIGPRDTNVTPGDLTSDRVERDTF